MANITTETNENGEKVFNIDPQEDDSLTLATANTYVDKNIIFNIPGGKYYAGQGIDITDDNYINLDNLFFAQIYNPQGENYATPSDVADAFSNGYNLLIEGCWENGEDNLISCLFNSFTVDELERTITADNIVNYQNTPYLIQIIGSTESHNTTWTVKGPYKLNSVSTYTATVSGETLILTQGTFDEIRADVLNAKEILLGVMDNGSIYYCRPIYSNASSVAFSSVVTLPDNTIQVLGILLHNDNTVEIFNTTPGGNTDITLTYQQVIDALGYTPYNGATNPNHYKSSVTSADITTGLGFIPYDSNNPNGYITKTVANLTNYYTKSEIDDLLKVGMEVEIVDTLPSSGMSSTTIYLVKSGQYYDQWMYIKGNWVKIGTTSIDLSAYPKTSTLATVAITNDYTDLTNKPNLANVALTGDYGDLINTPEIPTNISVFTNDSGYIKSSELAGINISTFRNDVPYAKLSDISALENLDIDEINKAIAATQNIGTVTRVQGGTGLTGDSTTNVVINHSNSVAANTAFPTGTTTTNGGTFTVRDVKYDTEGHITASQDRVINLPNIPAYDDTEVRNLISTEATARASEDQALSSQISGLDSDLSGVEGRVTTLEGNYTTLEGRVTAIENKTSVVYIGAAAPTSDLGEDGDIYIQS